MAERVIDREDALVLFDAFLESRPDFQTLLEEAVFGNVDRKRIWSEPQFLFQLAELAVKEKRRPLAKKLIEFTKKNYKHSFVPKPLQNLWYDGVYNIDEIAALLKLPKYEEVHENNLDYISETAKYQVGGEVDWTNLSEEFMEAEAEIENEEIFKPWHRGVMAAADDLFERHGLVLSPHGRVPPKALPFEYKVTPVDSWLTAASAIMATITGYGMFDYPSVQDFIDSGPYTPKAAVLSHLGWVKEYPGIYGSASAQTLFERAR